MNDDTELKEMQRDIIRNREEIVNLKGSVAELEKRQGEFMQAVGRFIEAQGEMNGKTAAAVTKHADAINAMLQAAAMTGDDGEKPN